jgi:hypothetical protein
MMNANKNNNRKGYGLSRESSLMHNFFFIKPDKSTSPEELADKLMGISCLKEVRVKSGTIGYNVVAKFEDDSYEKVESAIPKVVGPSYGKFVTAMELKRAMK